MSLHLIHGDPAALLASGPLIKAADVQPVGDAAALLTEAHGILAAARAAADELRARARAEGLAEAREEALGLVAERLAGLAHDLQAQSRRRDEELAGAALAAVRLMLGEAAPEIIGPALVREALASYAENQPVRVEVAPTLGSLVRAELGSEAEVDIVDNPSLGPLDCDIFLPSGTIRAGLRVQLEALAERWGLPVEATR